MNTDSTSENSYVLDPENPAEMGRLINQDRFITKEMGGPFLGLPDRSELRNILDLGCGPGGWVLDVAFDCPGVEVAGIDISRIMVDYANARARTQNLPNASFGVMDITQPLDFADGAFDVVNARFLGGVLRREAWVPFLDEATRVLRPGGVLRVTEPIDVGVNTSPAFSQLNAWLIQAMCRAGYGFAPDERSLCLTPMLPHLLSHAGYKEIQQRAFGMNFSIDTEGWIEIYRNAEVAYHYLLPLFLKTRVATEETIKQVYQQALTEMQASDFYGMWHIMSFWGTRP